jgi:hypothetical protein
MEIGKMELTKSSLQTLRCPKCHEILKYDDKATVHYCDNDNCDVDDGVYKDSTNLLKFGKQELVIHKQTHTKFMIEVLDLSWWANKIAEDMTDNLKHQIEQIDYDYQTDLLQWEELVYIEHKNWIMVCTLWQNKYYNTIDYKILNKVRKMWSNIIHYADKLKTKKLINRKQVIEYNDVEDDAFDKWKSKPKG